MEDTTPPLLLDSPTENEIKPITQVLSFFQKDYFQETESNVSNKYNEEKETIKTSVDEKFSRVNDIYICNKNDSSTSSGNCINDGSSSSSNSNNIINNKEDGLKKENNPPPRPPPPVPSVVVGSKERRNDDNNDDTNLLTMTMIKDNNKIIINDDNLLVNETNSNDNNPSLSASVDNPSKYVYTNANEGLPVDLHNIGK